MCPKLLWDHKDIGLLMKLMAKARVPGQPFHEQVVLREPKESQPHIKNAIVGSSMWERAILVQPVIFTISAPVAEAPIVL